MAPATAIATAKPAKQPKLLPAPNSDFYEVYETLNAEELATLKQVRDFMQSKVVPIINKYWAEDAFPFELLPEFKKLGIMAASHPGLRLPRRQLALLRFDCHGDGAL